MKPKICVSISPRTTSELNKDLELAKERLADFVEIRLENLKGDLRPPDLSASKKLGIPLIATNRNGLETDSSDQESVRLNSFFHPNEVGFEYVDLDLGIPNLTATISKFRENQVKIILSTHDRSKTPNKSELNSTLDKMRSFRPDIYKLVTTAKAQADNLTVLSLLEENHQSAPLVCFAMGREGISSRILAPFHGAPFTYASLEPGMETAPGQPSISELRQIYSLLGSD